MMCVFNGPCQWLSQRNTYESLLKQNTEDKSRTKPEKSQFNQFRTCSPVGELATLPVFMWWLMGSKFVNPPLQMALIINFYSHFFSVWTRDICHMTYLENSSWAISASAFIQQCIAFLPDHALQWIGGGLAPYGRSLTVTDWHISHWWLTGSQMIDSRWKADLQTHTALPALTLNWSSNTP